MRLSDNQTKWLFRGTPEVETCPIKRKHQAVFFTTEESIARSYGNHVARYHLSHKAKLLTIESEDGRRILQEYTKDVGCVTQAAIGKPTEVRKPNALDMEEYHDLLFCFPDQDWLKLLQKHGYNGYTSSTTKEVALLTEDLACFSQVIPPKITTKDKSPVIAIGFAS